MAFSRGRALRALLGVSAFIAASTVTGIGTSNARAAVLYTGSSGSWGVGANWNTASVPGNGADVIIGAGINNVTVTFQETYTQPGLNSLLISSNSATNTLAVTGGTLITQSFDIGNGGALTQSGGTIKVGGQPGADGLIGAIPGAAGAAGGTINLATSAGLTFTGGTLDLSGGQGGTGGNGNAQFIVNGSGGNGGNGGSLTLGQGHTITLSAGSALLLNGGNGGSAGTGGMVPGFGGSGGIGGILTIGTGATLVIDGGQLALNGGSPGNGGVGLAGLGGSLFLSGGILRASTSSIASSGAFLNVFNSGTLHLTDNAAFSFGAGTPVGNMLGGDNVTLGSNKTLVVASATLGAGKSLTITGGTLRLEASGASATPSFNIDPAASFNMNGGQLIARGNGGGIIFIAPNGGNGTSIQLNFNSSIALGNGSLIDLTGGNGATGSISVFTTGGKGGNGGSIVIGDGASLTTNNGSEIRAVGGIGGSPFFNPLSGYIGTGGTSGNGGNINVQTGGTFNFNGGLINLSGGTASTLGTAGTAGALTLAGGRLNTAIATLENNLIGDFIFSAGRLVLSDTATLTIGTSNKVTRAIGGNNATLSSNMTLDHSGDLTVAGGTKLTINGGTLNINKPGGTLTVQTGAQLDFISGQLTIAPSIVTGNGGKIEILDGDTVLTAGTISLRGRNASTVPFIAAGAGGTFIIAGNARVTLDGTALDLRGGSIPSSVNTGPAGLLLLDGGSLKTTQARLLATGGNFQFNKGTLHLTETANFFIGSPSIVADALGGPNAEINNQQTLIIAGSFSMGMTTSLMLEGTLKLTGGSAPSLAPNAVFAIQGGTLDLSGASGPRVAFDLTNPQQQAVPGGNGTALTLDSRYVVNLQNTGAILLSGGNGGAYLFSVREGGSAGALTIATTVNMAQGSRIETRGGDGGVDALLGNTRAAAGNGADIHVLNNGHLNFAGGNIDLRGGVGSTNGTDGTLRLNGGKITAPLALLENNVRGNFAFVAGHLHLIGNDDLVIGSSGKVPTAIGNALGAGKILTIDGALVVGTGQSFTLNAGAQLNAGKFNITGQLIFNTPYVMTEGELLNNGAITGAVTLKGTATGKGSGQFQTLSILDGGSFSPGNSPGVATSDFTTWAAGGTYIVEVAAPTGTPGIAWDLWHTGALTRTPGETFTIQLVAGPLGGWSPAGNYQWLIADSTTAGIFSDLSGLQLDTSSFNNTFDADGFSLFSPDGQSLYIVYVPEPASLMLLGLGAAGLLLRRRNRGK